MHLINASNAFSNSVRKLSSRISADAFIFLYTIGIITLHASGIIASSALNVSNNEACALSAPLASGDALNKAKGFLEKLPDDTVQSSAFFNMPGAPNAYSGVQIITASAF